MEEPSLTQYALCTIMIGALSLGAVLTKGFLMGKSQIKPLDTLSALFVGIGMMLTLISIMQLLGITQIELNKTLVEGGILAVLSGSVMIWINLRGKVAG